MDKVKDKLRAVLSAIDDLEGEISPLVGTDVRIGHTDLDRAEAMALLGTVRNARDQFAVFQRLAPNLDY